MVESISPQPAETSRASRRNKSLLWKMPIRELPLSCPIKGYNPNDFFVLIEEAGMTYQKNKMEWRQRFGHDTILIIYNGEVIAAGRDEGELQRWVGKAQNAAKHAFKPSQVISDIATNYTGG